VAEPSAKGVTRQSHALFLRLDVAKLRPIEVTTDIDSVEIEFRSDTRTLARAVTPIFGTMSARELTAIAIHAMSIPVFLRNSGLLWQPGFWLQVVLSALRLPADLRHARPRLGPKSVFGMRALAERVSTAAILAAAGPHTASDDARTLAQLIDEDRGQIAAPAIGPLPIKDSSHLPEGDFASPAGRRRYWEQIYRMPDPWTYGSAYEQLKYRRTLELMPHGAVAKAVELACSEGRFTEMLATRVEHLTAMDISETALGRARIRCRSLANVDIKPLDFLSEELPRHVDLLICSEVLCHLADRAQLASVGEKFAASLVPGGRLLTANLLLLKDDPSRTGFDFELPFGGRVIAEILAAVPGLAHERSLQTELYRIDLFRRLNDGETSPTAIVESVDLGPPPEPLHARHVVWGGATARRTDVQAREKTDRLPILSYHRIAEDGPPDLAPYRVTPAAFAEQMRWLRRNGYHAITSADVAGQLAEGRPFRGRPVMITFDDGYRDFHEVAWPILRTHDFCAEVMVVTDRVGGTADWDADYGPPATLMGWPEIQSLGASGICFGSHMASHRHMSEMTSREIVHEAATSRALIERVLGCECLSIAAPFGEADSRFVRIAEACGYKIGLTTDPGFARIDSDPMQLPRIQVAGDWSLAAFADAVRPER
jgi:peptidoglycan/xylan/chitin deacetylase (PgdA/CDA1 family)